MSRSSLLAALAVGVAVLSLVALLDSWEQAPPPPAPAETQAAPLPDPPPLPDPSAELAVPADPPAARGLVGTLLDLEGIPTAGRIVVTPLGKEPIRFMADPLGSFTCPAPVVGPALIEAWTSWAGARRRIVVPPEGSLDLLLHLEQGLIFEGRILDLEGRPQVGVRVGASTERGELIPATTGPGGEFTLLLSPCEKTELWLHGERHPSRWYFLPQDQELAEMMEPGADPPVFRLPRPTDRTARVVDGRGRPVPALQLIARARSTGPIDAVVVGRPTPVPGTWSFEGVAPGSWTVSAVDPGGHVQNFDLRWGREEEAPPPPLQWDRGLARKDGADGLLVGGGRDSAPPSDQPVEVELTPFPPYPATLRSGLDPIPLRLLYQADTRGRVRRNFDVPNFAARPIFRGLVYQGSVQLPFSLRPGASFPPLRRILGQIEGRDGRPIDGVEINGQPVRTPGGRLDLDLPRSTGILKVTARGFFEQPVALPSETGPEGEVRLEHPVLLARKPLTTIRVQDPRGAPIRGATVHGRAYAERRESDLNLLTTTDRQGEARVWLAPDRWDLVAAHTRLGRSPPSNHVIVGGESVTLTLQPARRVEGRADRPGRIIRVSAGLDRCIVAGGDGRYALLATVPLSLSARVPGPEGHLRRINLGPPDPTRSVVTEDLWPGEGGSLLLGIEPRRFSVIRLHSLEKAAPGKPRLHLELLDFEEQPTGLVRLPALPPGRYQLIAEGFGRRPRTPPEAVSHSIQILAGKQSSLHLD